MPLGQAPIGLLSIGEDLPADAGPSASRITYVRPSNRVIVASTDKTEKPQIDPSRGVLSE